MIKFKNAKLSVSILAILLIASFSFFVAAQEKNSTQNIFLDSDQDGLSDAEEKVYGTDPYKADTDGDGYSDGAEIQSGYDPLKKAPGDKIIISTGNQAESESVKQSNATAGKNNITKQIAQKISTITTSTDLEDQQITMEQVQSIAQDAANQTIGDNDLPTVSKDEIKIKKESFKNLSASEIKEKTKEDFINYLVAIFYIFSSNSPNPITSSTDFMQSIQNMFSEVGANISTQDTAGLKTFSESGQKMLDQIKDIEVPEDLVDLHLKALRFAKYAVKVPDMLTPNAEDPLSSLTSYSKLQAFIETLMNFNSEVQSKFADYGITYDDVVKGKIKATGIEPPILTETETIATVESTLATDASSASVGTSTTAVDSSQ